MKNTEITTTTNGKCPSCGRRLTNGATSIPLPLDTKFKRATTSIVRTLQQIEAVEGRRAARIARARLNEAIKLY